MLTAKELADVLGVTSDHMRDFISRQAFQPVGFRRTERTGRSAYAYNEKPIIAKFKQIYMRKNGRGRPRKWQQLDLFIHFSASH